MVFVLKPLTQVQQTEKDSDEAYKHKSRLVICGNFAAWGEHSMTTTNFDAPLLRLMLSLATAQETTWSNVDITSAFLLNADIREEDTVLVTPPPILVKMNIVKPNTAWHVKKTIDGLLLIVNLGDESSLHKRTKYGLDTIRYGSMFLAIHRVARCNTKTRLLEYGFQKVSRQGP